MAAIITEKFRLNNAKQFIEDITQSSSVAYSFIGRGHSWTDDATPPTPVDSPNDEFDAYRNMVAMKKISTSDISHAIVRRDWTSGTTYDEYRHNYSSANTANSGATTLYSSLFYVVTDDYNVYKCLNNDGNTASTVKPDHTTLSTPTESDGYQWKFMYSISASDVIKFVTNDFVPVKTLGAKLAVAGGVDTGSQDGRLGDAATDDGSAQWDVENGAVDGALQRVRIKAAGSGYTNATTANITIRGDGSGGVATVVTSGAAVTGVTITTAGSGYTTAFIANEDLPGNDDADQAADGTNASANIEFVIQPKNGHGADPVEELGGNYIILNSRLEYSEGSGDFPTDNDFRQIGVVMNPTDQGGNTLCSATTRTAYKKMEFVSSGFSAPTVDTVIRNAATEAVGTAVGIVVSVDTTNRIISYLPYPNESGNFVAFANGNTVYSASSTNHGTLKASSALTAEEVERHSGDIIYLENRQAVSRASDQIEDIKLIVEM
mgnify:FL=1|tara:strand:- start:568 stop:2040 length:1473 start_codon:yes stop_codon:yes gene_type:complete